MKFIKHLVIGILFFISQNSLGNNLPLQITEIISQNQITDYKGQKLILLDFWATWCGTCKPATKQLEVIQEQMKNDIFIISITNEIQQTVYNYIRKNPIKLLVVNDISSNLIRKFNINRRPQAVLLNTYGDIIWEGHPADLDRAKIKSFSKKYEDAPLLALEDILLREKRVEENSEIVVKNAFGQNNKDRELSIERSFATKPIFTQNQNCVKYVGSLFTLLAKLHKIPNHLVSSKTITDFFVKIETSKYTWDKEPERIINLIKNNFSIHIDFENRVENVYLFDIRDKSKLWNENKFRIKKHIKNNFFVSDKRITADNMTISDFALLLSNTQKQIYLYISNDNSNLYDWDLHFSFDYSIIDELSNKYRITIKKQKINIETINIW